MLQLWLDWIQTWTKLGSLSVRQQPAGCQTRSRRVDETQGWERDVSRFMVCTYFFLLKSPAFWKKTRSDLGRTTSTSGLFLYSSWLPSVRFRFESVSTFWCQKSDLLSNLDSNSVWFHLRYSPIDFHASNSSMQFGSSRWWARAHGPKRTAGQIVPRCRGSSVPMTSLKRTSIKQSTISKESW